MSFKKFLMATSFIASVSALPAMAADTIYFSGLNVCEGKRLVNSWKISIEEDGSSLIEVYQQPTTRGNISKKDYAGEGTGDGLLLTQNGRSLASVTVPADLSYVEGHWLNRAGDPNPDCEPFKFTNSGSPRDNFDTLLALYEVKDPTLEQAVEAAHLQRLLPPPHLLSELDQRSYQKRHEDSFSPFWRGFFEVQLTRMREMPIETAEDRENYIATVRQVTEFDFGPLGTLAESGATKDFAANVLRVAADRLADTDAPLMALPVSADTTCLVVRGFGRLEDDEFTLIAGLPTDYWTRDYAEVLLNVGRDCRKDFAKVFTNAYPRIEERQRQVEWVRAERKRLMEAPVTLAGFKESNWLSLDDELRRQNNISNDMVQRFIGDSLKSRREEMVQVSLEEITTEMDSKDIKTLTFADANKFCEEKLGRKPRRAEGLDALFDGCDAAAAAYEDTQNEKIVSERVAVALAAPKTLQGLRDADWFRLKSGEFTDWYPSREVRVAYTDRVMGHLAEAAEVAVGEVEAYYSNALATLESDTVLENVCEGLPGDEVFRRINTACQTGANKVQMARAELRCTAAVKESGASEELLAAEIEQTGAAAGKVGVRDLICGVAEANLNITFSSTGSLWWSEQHFEIGEENVAIGGKLEKNEDDGLLKVVDFKVLRGEEKAGMLPKVDKLFACFGKVEECR